LINKVLHLEGIEPVRFFGPNNKGFKLFKMKFPELEIKSRGAEIFLKGTENFIEEFEKAFNSVVEFLKKNKHLTLEDVERLVEKEEKAPINSDPLMIIHGQHGKIITARTKNQIEMVHAIEKNDILFAIGPAGTGKTYTAVALAVKALKNKEIKRIILCRPAVEAGENLGFLPGDMKEKIDPYLRPLYDALGDMLAKEKYEAMLESQTIEIAPMAFMRGRTLNNCFVILDEAQNATELQLKMLLTRMGPISKMVITGDLTQIDLPKNQKSGLKTAYEKLNDIKGISFIKLTESDVVRHPLVKEIIRAYSTEND
jgi:phosphate starvation-inducible protein PhoH and related proteins